VSTHGTERGGRGASHPVDRVHDIAKQARPQGALVIGCRPSAADVIVRGLQTIEAAGIYRYPWGLPVFAGASDGELPRRREAGER